ncbi:MAG: hypothetical protein Rhims3KO_18200 [Hyphomicrobiales bacterium]
MSKSTKTKTAEIKSAATISQQIATLNIKAQTWAQGTYKDSNDELHGVLEDSFALLAQLRASRAARKALEQHLESEGFTVRPNTSLELRVLRAVFNAEGRREMSYKRVLDVARAEKPSQQSLSDFIHERGGIEEIRRTPKGGISAADKAQKQKDTAERELANAACVGKRFKPAPILRPSADGTMNYSIALMREDADGLASIVWGTGKESLVTAVLKEAGKAIEEQQANLKVVSDNKEATTKRRSVVKALAKKATVAKAA